MTRSTLSALVIFSLIFAIGCAEYNVPTDVPTLAEETGEEMDMYFQVNQTGDFHNPFEGEEVEYDVGPVQVYYSEGILPSQDLYDWGADNFHEFVDPALTADTLRYDHEGTFLADGLVYTFTSDLPWVDPSYFLIECLVQTVHVDAPDQPWYAVDYGVYEVTDNNLVILMDIDLASADDFVTPLFKCATGENPTSEFVGISAELTGVINPRLEETGEVVPLEFEVHDNLVVYILPQ